MIQSNQLKKWVFTWNNYSEDWKDVLKTRLDKIAERYAAQAEIAKVTNTRHIQGCVFLNKRMRWSQFGLPKEIHWEGMKGKDSQAIGYVLKRDTRDKSQTPLLKGIGAPETIAVLQEKAMLGWQKETLEVLRTDPEEDDRIIYWRWDGKGKSGKSAFTKYLVVEHDALMLSGRSVDMKSAVLKFKEAKGYSPKIVIFDIPRSAEDYVSYEGMEEIKNGCFLSTKYDVGMVVMPCPHVICFANFEPDYGMLSEDRWDVREIVLTEEEEERLVKGFKQAFTAKET